LKIKQLAFLGVQKELLFQGKNPPSKLITWRKIHHLWGIFPSATVQVNDFFFASRAASTWRLDAKSLQSFPKCPLGQRRRAKGQVGNTHALEEVAGEYVKQAAGP